ncbi:MAG TPA: hypothetical protein VML01_02750 [Bryobacterales bacterium]|nr:hypothetical protein [Bryobacterales bacterium]
MEKKLDQGRQEMREDFSNIRKQLEAVARKEELAEVRSQIESVRRDDLTGLRNDLTRQLENLRKDNLAGVTEEFRKLSDKFQDLDKQTSDRLLAEIRHVIEPLVRDRAAQADAPKTKEASAGGAQVEGSTPKA